MKRFLPPISPRAALAAGLLAAALGSPAAFAQSMDPAAHGDDGDHAGDVFEDGPRGDGPRGRDGREGRERPTREQMAEVLRDIDPVLADEAAERLRGGDDAGRRGGREGRADRRGPDRERGHDDHDSFGDRDNHGDRVDGLRELFPQIVRLVRLKEIDPALYDLRVRDIRMERDTGRIVAEGRRLRGDATIEDADDRLEDLYEELEDKVEAHFELRQELRAAELERMEERLERLKEDLERRDDDQDALVARRVAELRGASGGW